MPEKRKEEVEAALYQIHGLANLLENASKEFENPIIDETSDPLLTVAQIIREKVNFCLEKLGQKD